MIDPFWPVRPSRLRATFLTHQKKSQSDMSKQIRRGGGWNKGETARRIELYSSAYQLAWKQIPPAQRRARPDISLRIHASIRRQLKQGALDSISIASAALKDVIDP